MAKSIEIVPLSDFSDAQVVRIGEELQIHPHEKAVTGMLNARHLWGVVARHSGEKSVASTREAREQMLQGKLGVYALLDSQSNRSVGMATLMSDLPLWVQRIALPAKFTRNNFLGRRVNTSGSSNAAAWVNTPSIDHSVQQLTEAYSFLGSQVDNAWTIEPLEPLSEVSNALLHAGYTPLGTPQAYDDMESGKFVAPSSLLYTHSRSS